MTAKRVIVCDACKGEWEPRPTDWAEMRVPWHQGRTFDVCRGCVSKLMGWSAPQLVKTA